MVYAELCAICGKAISHSTDKKATISLIPTQPALTVSRAIAERDAERTAERLVTAKKLSLVLDLDQTLVHATQDPAVEALFGPESVTTGDVTCAHPPTPTTDSYQEDTPKRNLFRFSLAHTPSKFYLKLRPHLQEFLMEIKDLFELHIYTMGSRSYARKVAQIIDPDQKLFRENIVSRDECGSINLKNLQRIFPVDDSMVMIVDDRVDVWQTSKNLLKIEPYFFFNDARVNALPRDKVDAPHPHRHPLRQSLRRSSMGLTNSSSNTSEHATTSSVEDDTIQTNKRKRADEESESALPPVHASSMNSSLLQEFSGRMLLTQSGTRHDDSCVEAEKQQQPQQQRPTSTARRPILPADLPKFKKIKRAPESEEGVVSSPNSESPMEEQKEDNTNEKESGSDSAQSPQLSSDESIVLPDSTSASHPPSLPYREAALHDSYLLDILRNLKLAHSLFFASAINENTGVLPSIEWPNRKRDIKYVLHVLRTRVLAGVHICFSSIFPSTQSQPRSTPLWKLAEEFGAQCYTTLDTSVTHLVALKAGTDKVKAAYARGNVKIVHLEWLLETLRTWHQPDVLKYSLPTELPPGVPEGLRPYEEQIRWLEMCYVRDLDKVISAHHRSGDEDEEEVSDADQDEFLQWALNEGEEKDDDEEEEEEEDGDRESEKDDLETKEGDQKQETDWDELEKELEITDDTENTDKIDHTTHGLIVDENKKTKKGSSKRTNKQDVGSFDRLAELQRMEEEEQYKDRSQSTRGRLTSRFKQFDSVSSKKQKQDDYADIINEIEDELFGDDDEEPSD